MGATGGEDQIGVLVADDDDDVRAALAALVDRHDQLYLTAAVADGDAAQVAAVRHRPAVAVLDVRMPAGGPELVRAIRALSPGTAVVSYTAHGDILTERQLRAAGATGFVIKGDRHVDLATAILEAGGRR